MDLEPTSAAPAPRSRLDLARAALETDGYWVWPSAFAEAELHPAREAFARLERRAKAELTTFDGDGARFVLEPSAERAVALQRVVWCGGVEPELLTLGLDPRVLGLAMDLLGETEVDQLVNQAHFKRPRDGVGFPMHQDAWNRRWGSPLWLDRNPDGDYLQVLLTIDEMRFDNGPLLVAPASHRYGPLVGEKRRAQLDAVIRAHPPEAVVAPPGSLVFFGPFLVHGSEPNGGMHPRRVLVNGFARTGVNRRVYPGAGLGRRRRRPQVESQI